MPPLYSSEFASQELPLGVTDTMLSALRRIRENRYSRGRNRWVTPSAADIRFDTVAGLKCRNLIVIRTDGRRERLELTTIGETVAEMVKAGRRRRKEAGQ